MSLKLLLLVFGVFSLQCVHGMVDNWHSPYPLFGGSGGGDPAIIGGKFNGNWGTGSSFFDMFNNQYYSIFDITKSLL